MTDERRGWRRYAGHVAIWFLIPHAIRGMVHLAWGADSFLVALPPFLVCSVAVLVILGEEMIELALKRQGPAKTLIDLSAVFGVPAGIKAISATVSCRDSGSAATNNLFVILSRLNRLWIL